MAKKGLDPRRIKDSRGRSKNLDGKALRFYDDGELGELLNAKNSIYDDDVAAHDPIHARDSISVVIRCLHELRYRGQDVRLELAAAHVRARDVGPAADGHHKLGTSLPTP